MCNSPGRGVGKRGRCTQRVFSHETLEKRPLAINQAGALLLFQLQLHHKWYPQTPPLSRRLARPLSTGPNKSAVRRKTNKQMKWNAANKNDFESSLRSFPRCNCNFNNLWQLMNGTSYGVYMCVWVYECVCVGVSVSAILWPLEFMNRPNWPRQPLRECLPNCTVWWSRYGTTAVSAAESGVCTTSRCANNSFKLLYTTWGCERRERKLMKNPMNHLMK